MMFKIDFNRLVMLLLPSFYRQPLIFGVLRAAIGSVWQVYDEFTTMRQGHIYRLTHNGQVCYLQAVLNDTFDKKKRRFSIMSVERVGEWLYAITETGSQIPLTGDETVELVDAKGVPVVYDEFSLNAESNNFIVNVPAEYYQTGLAEIAALVDRYKLISKRAVYRQQS